MSKNIFALNTGLLAGLMISLCSALLRLPATSAYVSFVNMLVMAFGILVSLRIYRDRVLGRQNIKFGEALWFCVKFVFWIAVIQLVYYCLQLYFWKDPAVYELLEKATGIMASSYSGTGLERISYGDLQNIVKASSFLSVFLGYMFTGLVFALSYAFFASRKYFENKGTNNGG